MIEIARKAPAAPRSPSATRQADIQLLKQQPTPQRPAAELEPVRRASRTRNSRWRAASRRRTCWPRLGLVIGSGSDANKIAGLIGNLTGVPGRIEHVADTPAGGAVYVDYAHKPGALEAVLTTLRPHAARQLAVVFGCGGDRDRGKRPMMGEIATRLADRVIVTDDNPRSEDPGRDPRRDPGQAPGRDRDRRPRRGDPRRA